MVALVAAAPITIALLAVVPEVRQVPEAGGARLQPLYERFRKHSPPTFEGGQDLTRAEQWMSMIRIVLDFMDVVDGRSRQPKESENLGREYNSIHKNINPRTRIIVVRPQKDDLRPLRQSY